MERRLFLLVSWLELNAEVSCEGSLQLCAREVGSVSAQSEVAARVAAHEGGQG